MFDIANVRKVQDNLTLEEQQAMKEFRSTPIDGRDLVIRLQEYFPVSIYNMFQQTTINSRWESHTQM